MDAIILELDVGVTLAAGGGHVHGVDAGIGIALPLQVVDAVAIRAGCCDSYAPRCSLPVHGQGVLLEGLGSRTSWSVRRPASPWHVAQVSGAGPCGWATWVRAGAESGGNHGIGRSSEPGDFPGPGRSREGSREKVASSPA